MSHGIMQCISKHNARLLRMGPAFPDNMGNNFHQKKIKLCTAIWHRNLVATFCSGRSRQLWMVPNRNLGENTFKLHYISNDIGHNPANLGNFSHLSML